MKGSAKKKVRKTVTAITAEIAQTTITCHSDASAFGRFAIVWKLRIELAASGND